CFTDKKCIPMPISTKYQMGRLWSSLDGTVQLDLEGFAHLGRNDQMFLILMQIAVFSILPELNGMPPVRLLETREAHIGKAMLPCCKEPFQGFGEAVCKHLYRCGWHMLTLSLEYRCKLMLTRECPMLLILFLDEGQHGIIDHARLFQTLHESLGLFFIWIQAVFIGSHELILQKLLELSNGQG